MIINNFNIIKFIKSIYIVYKKDFLTTYIIIINKYLFIIQITVIKLEILHIF